MDTHSARVIVVDDHPHLGAARGTELLFVSRGLQFTCQKIVQVRCREGRMICVSVETLRALASKYIWWKTPDEAVTMPQRVIAQVMNMGDYADVQSLAARAGDEVLREVLTCAEAGQFNERSWAYWHYRLGLSSVDHVPALPVRRFE